MLAAITSSMMDYVSRYVSMSLLDHIRSLLLRGGYAFTACVEENMIQWIVKSAKGWGHQMVVSSAFVIDTSIETLLLVA